jgi:hypothetical protein
MDRSSPSPVNPADLYEGPEPVLPFPGAQPKFTPLPDVSTDKRSRPDYVATITAALDVLGARLLALIAVIAACAMWSWSVYKPEPDRLYAAIGFSLTVLLPLVVLYFKRG